MNGTYRWEWRTFAKAPAYAEVLWIQRTADTIVTREQYVLSAASPHAVKVRDDCLEIKLLLEVAQDGLEQWRPLIKEVFPLGEAALDAAWVAWGIPAPIISTRHCTLDEFFSEVVDNEPLLSVVEIEKKRTSLPIAGCPGEHVAIQVGGESWESLAFAHMDPFRVWRAVAAMGMENVENTSYPAALKRIVNVRASQRSLQMEHR